MTKISPPVPFFQMPITPISIVIDALKERTSWPNMRDVLKNEKLPVGSGWLALQIKAEEKVGSGPEIDAYLRKFHSESIVNGERYIKLYDADKSLLVDLVNQFTLAAQPNNDFSTNYPFPVSPDILKGMNSDLSLTEIRKFETGDCCLVFCSSRSYDYRETYSYKQLGDSVREVYKNIDELITVQKMYFQAYDVVILRPSLGRVEICIDHPTKSGSKAYTNISNDLINACTNASRKFGEIFQTSPVNLFAAISGIYKADKEGTIKSLTFRTLTGSTKHERMVTSQDDLRAEKFHSAGAEAVKNEIRPYEIEVDFTFTLIRGNATIKLSAPVRELSAEPALLFGCYVDCSRHTSFVQAINKIVKYL